MKELGRRLIRSNKFVYCLVALFALFAIFSTMLILPFAIQLLPGELAEASAAPKSAAVVAPFPTPTQPTPVTPTSTPTPIANPYEFAGVRFDSVSEEEVREGVTFDVTDSRVATISFMSPEGDLLNVKFLPIRDFEWMEEFDAYCPAGSHKACVYTDGVHLTIMVHFSVSDQEVRINSLRKSIVNLYASFKAIPLELLWIEKVSGEKISEYRNLDPSYLLSLISESWEPTPDARFIVLFSENKGGCTTELSCNHWIIVLKE